MKQATKLYIIFSLLCSLIPFGVSDRLPLFAQHQEEAKPVVCSSKSQPIVGQKSEKTDSQTDSQRTSDSANMPLTISADYPLGFEGLSDEYNPRISMPNSDYYVGNAVGPKKDTQKAESSPSQQIIPYWERPALGSVYDSGSGTLAPRGSDYFSPESSRDRSHGAVTNPTLAPGSDRRKTISPKKSDAGAQEVPVVPGYDSGDPCHLIDPHDREDSDLSRGLTPTEARIVPIAADLASSASVSGPRLIVRPGTVGRISGEIRRTDGIRERGEAKVETAAKEEKAVAKEVKAAKLEPREAKVLKRGKTKAEVAAKEEKAVAKELKAAKLEPRGAKAVKRGEAKVEAAVKEEKAVAKELKAAKLEPRGAKVVKRGETKVEMAAKEERSVAKELKAEHIEAHTAKAARRTTAEVQHAVQEHTISSQEVRKQGAHGELHEVHRLTATMESRGPADRKYIELPCEKCLQEYQRALREEEHAPSSGKETKAPEVKPFHVRIAEGLPRMNLTFDGKPLESLGSEFGYPSVESAARTATPKTFHNPLAARSSMMPQMPKIDMPAGSSIQRLPGHSAAVHVPRQCTHMPRTRVRVPRGGTPAQRMLGFAGDVALNFALDHRIRHAAVQGAVQGAKTLGSKFSDLLSK